MFNLRKYFMLDPTVTFLSHGSFGASPRPVFRQYQRWQRELENQPVEFLGRRITGLLVGARTALGEYLGTQAENLVYTQNVTISLNMVARSLELGPGDVSGDVRGDWEPVRHQRYSLVIVPFMGGCSFNYLYEHLVIVNDEFWNMFDEKKKKAPHNFTLLSFPKKDET